MKKQIVMALALAALSIPALASNVYVTGHAGKSKFTIDGASGSESDTTFSFGGGYKFNETWSAELNFRDLGEIKGSEYYEYDNGVGYESLSFKLAHSTIEASLVGAYPLNNDTYLYGRAGVGKLKRKADIKYVALYYDSYYIESGSASESKNKMMFGVGLRHDFSPSFGARLEYNRYSSWDDFEIAFSTVGLVYQF